jgi:hypothetical protein
MMDKDYIEIRIKIGSNEIEIKGSRDDVKDLLSAYLPYIFRTRKAKEPLESEVPAEKIAIPPIKVTDKEPVSRVLMKLFNTSWAKTPRALNEVIEALNSIGLYYQKSTIAVNLKRLVQRGELRRIKGKDGIYLYVPTRPPIGEGD